MSSLKPPQIENFANLLEPHLTDGAKLISYESEYFMAPGDNYGSTIFKVTAKIQKPTSSTPSEQMHLIGKLLPENELFLNIFQPNRTFRTEMSCYTTLAPAFLKLQKDAKISENDRTNVFAKCYGSRISLEENAEKVDRGAALILENLAISGYGMGDRLKGFDRETVAVVLRDLARYHAMGIALRLKNPQEFDAKIKPFVKIFSVEKEMPEQMRSDMLESNLDIIKNLPSMNDNLLEKIMFAFNLHEERLKILEPCPDSLFSTVVHQDFWTNNILIKYGESKKPKDIKIVDFQVAEYNSLAHDVIFFLFSSVEIDILKEKYDEILKEYYTQLINWLEQLGCSTNDYSYELFDRELCKIAPYQFQHIVTMRKVLSFKRDKIPDIKDMDSEFFQKQDTIDDSYYDILQLIIDMYEKRYFPYMK